MHYERLPEGHPAAAESPESLQGEVRPLLYRFGDFELDPVARRLERSGREVPLQPRPFDLLLYLLEHCDRVVSRDELIEQVWGVAVGPQALGVALHAVRRALEDDGETQALLRTLRGSGIQFAAPVLSAPSPLTEDRLRRRERELPLLGRKALRSDAELAMLAVERGAGHAVFLHGEAGIGKSHAIEHLAAMALRRGFQVYGGRCAEGEASAAFQPWRQIAQAVTRGQTTEQLAATLGVTPMEVAWLSRDFESRKPDRAEQDWLTQGARLRLFALLVTLLARVSADRPLFLSIDDVHRADPGSIALLEYVLARLAELRVLLVVSYREVDREEIARLEGEGTAHTTPSAKRSVALRGLGPADIQTLFESLTGVRIRADLARELRERTRGNPFFLMQLSRVLGAEERLDQLSPDDLEALALPKQVHEAVLLQLRDLSSRTLEVLQLASLAGRDFRAADLEIALGLGPQELAELLEAPTRAHILCRGDVPGQYAFVHLLVRDAIVASLDDRTKSVLHSQLARSIEQQVKDREWLRAAELAHHYVEAISITGPDPAIDYLETAADWASQRMGYEDAVGHLSKAIQLQASGQPSRISRTLTKLAVALVRLGRRDEARTKFELAADIARRARLGNQLAEIALEYSPDFLAVETGIVDHAHVTLLREALTHSAVLGPGVESQLQARLAVALHWSDESLEAARTMASSALKAAKRAGDTGAIAYAQVSAAFTSFSVDAPLDLLSLDPRTLGSADPLIALVARVLRVTGHWLLGDTGNLRIEIEEFAGESRQVRLPRADWYVWLWKASLAYMEGRFRHGDRYQAQFIAVGDVSGDHNVVHSRVLQQFLVSVDRGGIEEFGVGIDYMIEKYPLVWGWRAGQLLYLVETEQNEQAHDLLEQLLNEKIIDKPRRNEWLGLAVAMSIASSRFKNAACARRIYDHLLPHRKHTAVIGYGSFCMGSVARFLGLCAIGFGNNSLARRHLVYSLRRNREIGARAAVARVLADLAHLEFLSGDEGAAGVWARRSMAISSDLGMDRLTEQLKASSFF